MIEALEGDRELDFKDIGDKYLQKGTCPNCGKEKLFISRDKPYQLKCNRDNECQFEQKTRERYSYLFENLSERFPATETNPNATADAYLLRNRYGYTGEVRAIGDVLRDQLFSYLRVGFDAFALREDKDPQDALKAFEEFREVYQASTDQPLPLFRRRA